LGSAAGQPLAEHPGIDRISCAGSPDAGRRVAEAAAAHRCPVTLELGGKSPQLVFADADLDAALPVLVGAIIQNAGQTCSAGSRGLVDASIEDELQSRLAERFSALRVGPANADLDLGPLVWSRQRARVREFVDASVSQGLAPAAQGKVVDGAPAEGFYQAPLLFSKVPSAARLFQEEVFGPVLAVTPFRDETDALAL